MSDREPAAVPAVPETEVGTRLPAKNPKSPSPAWIVAGGAVGTALGFITALPGVVGIPAFGATVLYLIVRAVKSMKSGSQLGFQLQNFAVWFGLAVGGTAMEAFPGVETFTAAARLLARPTGPDPTRTLPPEPSPDRSDGSGGGAPTTHSAPAA